MAVRQQEAPSDGFSKEDFLRKMRPALELGGRAGGDAGMDGGAWWMWGDKIGGMERGMGEMGIGGVRWGMEVVFCFSCFVKMFPLHVLDQVQLTLLTHEKTASLKTRKKRTTRVPCSAFFRASTKKGGIYLEKPCFPKNTLEKGRVFGVGGRESRNRAPDLAYGTARTPLRLPVEIEPNSNSQGWR